MTTPTSSAFIASFGTLDTYAAYFGNPMFVLGASLLDFTIGYDWLNGRIDTVHMLYLATVVGLLIEFMAAAYIVVKITDIVVDFSQVLAHQYRQGSIIMNQLGLYEFGYVSLYYIQAMTLVVMAFFGASQIWETLEEREAGAAEGFLGRAVSWTHAIKYMTMGTAVLAVTYYAAYSVGETIDQTIGWFKVWTQNSWKYTEATRKNGQTDAQFFFETVAGSSLSYDLNYHAVHTFYSWGLFSFIIFAGHWYASNLLGFKELDECDLDGVDESYYSDVRALIAQEVDLASCKNAVKGIFRIADLNGNGHIDRCENAKFLYGLGNSQKYALNFNEEKSLALLYAQVCYPRFSE